MECIMNTPSILFLMSLVSLKFKTNQRHQNGKQSTYFYKLKLVQLTVKLLSLIFHPNTTFIQNASEASIDHIDVLLFG
jgi:hypothetical protein